MAIHKTVFHSPDRRIRVMADPGGRRFTVERDKMFAGTADSVAELEALLAGFGVTLEELTEG